MTLDEVIEKFERQEKAAQAVLDSGFGAMPGESNRRYLERREMAAWALKGLRRLKEQEETNMIYDICFDLRYAPQDMTDEEKIEMARQCTGQDLAMLLMQKGEFWVDHENNCVRGTIRDGLGQHG